MRGLVENWRCDAIAAGKLAIPTWKGFPPAGPGDLARLESRLGRRLPPTYREFLSLSDGWPTGTGGTISGLRRTSRVMWFREAKPEWLRIWLEVADSPDLDVHLLARALLVSEPGPEALLLDPDDIDVVTEEWPCYVFSSVRSGPVLVAPSFLGALTMPAALIAMPVAFSAGQACHLDVRTSCRLASKVGAI
jgi:hypothetical protein